MGIVRFRKSFVVFVAVFALFSTGTDLFGQAAAGPLTVVSEPKAVVWINDVRYGQTGDDGRLSIPKPPAGRKTIRVRAYGFKEATRNLLPTQSGEIKIELTKTNDEAELAFQDAERHTAIDRNKAAEFFRKAIDLRANYPEAYLGLARVEADLGNIEEAFKAVRSALRLRPVYPEASAVEGRLLKDTGDEQKAIAAFRRAITQGRGVQPEAHTGLGMLFQDRAEQALADGEITTADASYEEAAKNFSAAIRQLGSAPDAGVLYQMLGRILEQQQKYKEAIALYERFLTDFPDAVEAPAVRSFIVQLKKQLEEQP